MARQTKASDSSAALTFGQWLRALREGKKFPLRAVAAAAQMDQAHLSKVELGQRSLTSFQAVAIAKFLKVDAQVFEARRIVDKICIQYAKNPAMHRAIRMLHEEPEKYASPRNSR